MPMCWTIKHWLYLNRMCRQEWYVCNFSSTRETRNWRHVWTCLRWR